MFIVSVSSEALVQHVDCTCAVLFSPFVAGVQFFSCMCVNLDLTGKAFFFLSCLTGLFTLNRSVAS